MAKSKPTNKLTCLPEAGCSPTPSDLAANQILNEVNAEFLDILPRIPAASLVEQVYQRLIDEGKYPNMAAVKNAAMEDSDFFRPRNLPSIWPATQTNHPFDSLRSKTEDDDVTGGADKASP